MKTLSTIIVIFLSVSTASAGLFEYHLTGHGTSNITSSELIDAVESIHPNSVKNKETLISNSIHTSDYRDTRYDWTYGNLRLSREYYSSNSNLKNFYKKDDLIDILEEEIDDIKREEREVDREIDRLKDDLRDIRNASSGYYGNLRDDLEQEIEYLEDIEDSLQDIRKEIEKEVRDVRKNSNTRINNSYYYNYYSNNNYGRNNKYGHYWYNYYWYYDERTPSWVNSELQEVRDGRVWIR